MSSLQRRDVLWQTVEASAAFDMQIACPLTLHCAATGDAPTADVATECTAAGRCGTGSEAMMPQSEGQARQEQQPITDLPGLSDAEAALVQRFNPSGPRDTIGFFIARFRKQSLPGNCL